MPLPFPGQTRVSEIMTNRIESIAANESVFEAVHRMVNLNIGSLAVVIGTEHENKEIIGMLPVYETLRHLLTASQGRDVLIKDVMFDTYITIEEDSFIGDALRQVTTNRTWRLIVLNRERTPVGVISVTDIVKWLVRQLSESQ